MKQHIPLSLLLVCFTGVLFSQTLEEQLNGKKNLAEIMASVEQHYKDPGVLQTLGQEQSQRNLKHWYRWAYYMSSRTDLQGNLVNISEKMLQATGVERPATNLAAKDGITQQSSAGNWVAVGPTVTTSGIGRVDRLAFHPTNANTVWAGAAGGGLWRTTDGGSNWTNLTPNITNQAISGIAVNPNNTNTIYILTGDGDSNIGGGGLVQGFGYMRTSIGVLKTTNGGGNWLKTADFPGADYSTLVGYRLTMHPTNPDILYACTNQGLYGTINGGDTWALLVNSGRTYNLMFKPGSGNIAYMVSRLAGSNRACFWRSTGSFLFGIWDTTLATNNLLNNPVSRVELAVTPASPSNVYLVAGGVPGAGGSFGGVIRSVNDGVSFTTLTTSPNVLGRASDGSDAAQQSNYDLAIAVSNTGSNTVITGGVRCWRYFTNTGSWAYRGGHHEDVHDLGFHPVDNKLWMANDGGVYTSTDNGANWTEHFSDMNASHFYRMAVSPADYLNMFAGAQDNGLKRRTGNTATFDHISGADGFTVGYDAANSNTMYAVINQNIRRSTNGGDNWNSITPNNAVDNPFAMSMAPSTSTGNTLFVASDTFWRTTNGGTNWTNTNVNGGWFMRTCPSNGSRIYLAGGNAFNSSTGTLRRSDDAGQTWPAGNILSSNTGFPSPFPKITSINVDPTNSLRVWVTFGGFTAGTKVFYSSNGGTSWVNRSGTLPNVPINCIALDDGNNAYLGTDNGIYYRSTSMSDWVPFYNGLPYVPVTDIVISQAENRIRASTFGRGIWSSDLYSSCDPSLAINGTITGRKFYEASNSITSDALVQTSEGSSVQMRAGTQVRLLAGFTAREQTQFRAAIGPCGSGGAVALFGADGAVLEPEPVRSGGRGLLHLTSGGASPGLMVTMVEAGAVSFQLTNEEGMVLQEWPAETMSAGVANKTLQINRQQVPNGGMYQLHMLVNGVRTHMQELLLQ